MLETDEMAQRAETAFTSDFLNDEVYSFTAKQETIVTCPTAISPVPKIAKQYDLRQLESAWNRGWLNWGGSPVHRELLQSLKTVGSKMPEISKVVCVGLGSPSGDLLFAKKAGAGQAKYQNITQHMFAITLAKTLSKRFERRIPLMAFDLKYTENDKKILSRNEIEVIEGYVAVTDIDSKTFVVCFDPSFPLDQVISNFVKPAAIIWDQAVSISKTTLRGYFDRFFAARIRPGKNNMCTRKLIIDRLANAIETELELPKTNGIAKHGCGNTHLDDIDGVVIVDYEPEDEWVLLG